MQFVYKPEGAEPKKWDFDSGKLMNVESEAIERVSKMTFGEWTDAVQRGSVTALHALLWVMLKRGEPTLAYDAVQFNLSEVDFELSDEESAETRTVLETRLSNGEELSVQERALLESVRESTPAPAEPAEDSDVPKAIALGSHLAS